MRSELSYYLQRIHWLIAFPDYKEKFAELLLSVKRNLGITKNENYSVVQCVKDEKGRYAFIDNNQKVVKYFDFEDAYNFYENLAAIKIHGKWGFIDKKGDIVVVPQYDDVDVFRGGLARVKSGSKWGFINKKNEIIIPIKYDSCSNFNLYHLNVAKVYSNGNHFFINKAGGVVTS